MSITIPDELPKETINEQQAHYERIQDDKKHSWLKVFTGGLVLYIFGVFALAATRNTNIFPTVVMLGNFLVPITYVAFFYQRRHLSKLDLPTTAWAFFYGGLLGVLAAATLEPIFLSHRSLFYSFEVGLIEEFAKIIGVLIIAKRCFHDSEMDGLILGAASGMGFAALESTGYAFTAFLNSGGSLSQTVLITLVRGVIAPIGHGTWTAILVSTMFRESGPRKFHINHKGHWRIHYGGNPAWTLERTIRCPVTVPDNTIQCVHRAGIRGNRWMLSFVETLQGSKETTDRASYAGNPAFRMLEMIKESQNNKGWMKNEFRKRY